LTKNFTSFICPRSKCLEPVTHGKQEKWSSRKLKTHLSFSFWISCLILIQKTSSCLFIPF